MPAATTQQTVSSAADVLKMAALGMSIPTFAEVVALPQVTLPLVGTLANIVTEVGTNGVIGIKSGYTSEAGACMVLAANRLIQGRSVLVIVDVLGQPTPPPTLPKPTPTTTTTRPPPTTTTVPPAPGAPPPPPTTTTTSTTTTRPPPTTTTTTLPLTDLPIADPFKFTRPVVDSLLAATRAAIVPVTVATAGATVGSVTTVWGGQPHTARYVTASDAWLPGWPGQVVKSMTRFVAVPPGSPARTLVGSSIYAVGLQFQVVRLRLIETVPEPSVWWRLQHTP